MIDYKKLIPCGTLVELIYSPDIKGMITAHFIRFDTIQYEVSYFIGGDKIMVYLNENEFKVQLQPKEIGFNNNNNLKK